MSDDFYKPSNTMDSSIGSGAFELISEKVEAISIPNVSSPSREIIEVETSVETIPKSRISEEKMGRVINRMAILKAVFGTLIGKDRVAKIFKYVIDLLLLFIKSSTYNNNISLDIDRYSKLFSNNNILSIVQNPKLAMRIIVSKSSKLFLEKGTLVSSQLSFYRQIMRCGYTPFRLHHWYHKFLDTLHAAQKSKDLHSQSVVWYKEWWNEDTLSDFIDLYYGIMDELMLLHKLRLWSNKRMYSWVSKHEALSWYYDIILGLKKNWEKLQSIKQKEFELKIQYQVRQRALELSSKLNESSTSSAYIDGSASLVKQNIIESFKQSNLDLEQEMVAKLQSYQHDKRIIKFDLIRLFFDFLADSTDVFGMKTPPGTYAALSLCSGVLGFSKLWVQAEEDLKK